MRDVTPGSHSIPLKSLLKDLVEFIKNPIHKISILPDWNWPSVLTVQILLALISGIVAAIINLKFEIWLFARGIILMPIATTVSALLLSLFIYYYFQFFENRTESFRKIVIFVILASVPFYIFQIASVYFAPITLIGFLFTSLLAIVGLSENFRVERKRAYLLVGVLFLIVLMGWISNRMV